MRKFPSNGRGALRNRCFTAHVYIVQTIADRHRFAAYYNKHHWQAQALTRLTGYPFDIDELEEP